MPSVRNKSPRITSIDAARGAAMLFVCLAHFAAAYLGPLHASEFASLTAIGMVASPTFMTISGMTTGFLGVTFPRSLPYLRRRLLDRGMFMLLIGHLVLAIAYTVHGAGLISAYRTSFITDSIAIAIMIGPRLVGRMTALARIALAVSLYATAWILASLWHPASPVASVIKPYLTGSLELDASGWRPTTFPLLQWMAVYLLGSILGEYVGKVSRCSVSAARRPFLRTGLLSTALGLAIHFSAQRMAVFQSAVLRGLSSLHLASPTQKYPPGPTYLLFFGGVGLIGIWFVLALESRQVLSRALRYLQQVGQASLMVYLLQEFVYSSLRRLQLPYTVWWPLLFVVTLLPLAAVADFWCRIDGNRFLTVGITALLERRAHQPVSKAPIDTGRPGYQAT